MEGKKTGGWGSGFVCGPLLRSVRRESEARSGEAKSERTAHVNMHVSTKIEERLRQGQRCLDLDFEVSQAASDSTLPLFRGSPTDATISATFLHRQPSRSAVGPAPKTPRMHPTTRDKMVPLSRGIEAAGPVDRLLGQQL
jgi:hypothetical protein